MLDFIKLLLFFLFAPVVGAILVIEILHNGLSELAPYAVIGVIIGIGNGIYQSHFADKD